MKKEPKLIYKQVKVMKRVCSVCGENRGNGSVIQPHRCECGIYEYDRELNNYKLKPYEKK